MKITLIRHTLVAVETGICYGWSDVGVAPSFETEASRVKENISISCIAARSPAAGS